MITPYPHQANYLKNPSKNILVWDCGTGKSHTCGWWLKGKDKDALVICPKNVKEKWKEVLKECGTQATVVTKEEFKKLEQKEWSALIVDEADNFASPLFMKGRSQLSTALYHLIRSYPNMPRLLATATPIRSSPANLHSILVFAGIYIEWKKWRDKFYSLQRMPFLPRPAYLPVKGWQKMMRPIIEKYCDIVSLKDCVGSVPDEDHEVVEVKGTKFEGSEWDNSFHEEHRHEQKGKVKHIKEIGRGFRKVMVVAYYREQIDELEKELKKERETFVIHGGIADQESVIKEAQESDECYIIVQASIGAGFDADSFSCMVFASMSYSVRDYIQMTHRIKRIHNLHPVKYYYLHAGRCDKAVYKQIKLGFDFVPSKWDKIL